MNPESTGQNILTAVIKTSREYRSYRGAHIAKRRLSIIGTTTHWLVYRRLFKLPSRPAYSQFVLHRDARDTPWARLLIKAQVVPQEEFA